MKTNNIDHLTLTATTFPRLRASLGTTLLAILTLSGASARAADGDLDPTFTPLTNPLAWDSAATLVVQPDGKILVGGDYFNVSGQQRTGLARLNADGTLDATFNAHLHNNVHCLVVQADGKIVMGGWLGSVARLNADGTQDATFNLYVDSDVNCMAVQPDGKILIGGSFYTAGTDEHDYIARVNSDGSVDTAFAPSVSGEVRTLAVQADGKILVGGDGYLVRLNANGSPDAAFSNVYPDNSVRCVTVQPDGKILVGGVFTYLGGQMRTDLARLNANGTLDTAFNANLSNDGSSGNGVYSIMLQADGRIFAGGYFSTIGFAPLINAARFNSDGTIDPSFASDPDYPLYGMALQGDGGILLAGTFYRAGGQARPGLARLFNSGATQALTRPDSTRVQWLRGGATPEVEQVTFEQMTGSGGTWTSLGSGTRIAGGWEKTGVSLPANGFVRARGRACSGWDNGSSGVIEQIIAFGSVPDIGVLAPPGTNLIKGVSILSFGTLTFGQTSAPVVVTITNSGAATLTLRGVNLAGDSIADYLLNTNGLPGTLAPSASTTFTVTFRPIGDSARCAAIQINSNDGDETPFDIGLSGTCVMADPTFNHTAGAIPLALQADGKILVGNDYSGLLRLNADGTLDPALNVGAYGYVYGAEVQSDGKIVVAGTFTMAGGQARSAIARFNADGTIDTSYSPSLANDWGPRINALALQPDGKILMGGYFTNVAGQGRNNFARLNADGTLDTTFNAGLSHYYNYYSLYSVAVQPDGKIVMGGDFYSVGGLSRPSLARVSANGVVETNFNANVSGTVYCLAVQADGKILLGGTLSSVGGQTRNGLARINTDGSLDTAFNPNVTNSGSATVYGLALQANGKILVGGSFSSVGGQARYNVARLNPDGSLDTLFNPGASSTVGGFVVQPDGKILLGGSAIRLLNNEPATQTLVAASSAQVQWLRGGGAPEIDQVTFELMGSGGSTWASLGSGTRIAGGWQLTGLSLPANGFIRARGRATGGYYNSSSSPIEQITTRGAVPDIGLSLSGTNLTDGLSMVSAGMVVFGQSGPQLVFTVTNSGTANLVLGTVTITGPAAGDYILNTAGMATTLTAGGSTTFRATFTPLGDGTRTATLQIPSNDGDETPFDVTLSGACLRTELSFNPNVGFQYGSGQYPTYGGVYATVIQTDGKILLGGTFDTIGGQYHSSLARLNADGTLDSAFNPSVGWVGQHYNLGVGSLAVQADGKILLGGSISSVGGLTRNRLARLNADGIVDTGFNPNVLGPTVDTVYCLGLQTDGKILVGGIFTNIAAQARTGLARLNADGTLDSAFNPSVSNSVYTVAIQSDGKILVGGSFTNVAGQARTNLVRLSANGTVDSGFNPAIWGGPYYEYVLGASSLAVQADGKILLGGDFYVGQAHRYLVRLNADGSLDTTFSPMPNQQVLSLALQADGKILLAGDFSTVNGQTYGHAARLNSDGTLDPTFNPKLAGISDSMINAVGYSLAIQPDGKILLGGSFSAVDGQPCGVFARLLNEPATQILSRPDAARVRWLRSGTASEVEQVTFDLFDLGGSAWNSLGTAARISGGWEKTGLSLPASGFLRAHARAAGGEHDGSSGLLEQVASFGSVPRMGVQQPAGTPLTNGISTVSFGTLSYVQSPAVLTFTITNTGAANLLLGTLAITGAAAGDYALNTTGMATTIAPAGRTTFTVTFRPSGDGPRSASLQIPSNDGYAVPFTIGLSGTGVLTDPQFSPDVSSYYSSYNLAVFGMAVQPDGKLLLGGNLYLSGGLPWNYACRLNANGMLDTTFNPNISSGPVYALAAQPDGKILLGGHLTSVGGQTRNGLARVQSDGTLDPSFNAGINNSANVYCLALQPDGKVLVGGDMYSVSGQVRQAIARLKSDGTLDTNFNANVGGYYNCVNSLALQPDGKILLGGKFLVVGGQNHTNIARLNADGTPDGSFNARVDVNPDSYYYSASLSCLALQGDGKILLGGSFTNVNGQARTNLARLNSNGTLDTLFNPSFGLSNAVYSIALQADGKILIGGNLSSVGGQSCSNVARLNPDGTPDPSFKPAVNKTVSGIALQAGGQILLGGSFTTVGGQDRLYVARLLNDSAADAITRPDNTRVQWLRSGSAPEVGQTTFDLSTDGLNWTPLGSGSRIASGWEMTGLSLPTSGFVRAQGRASSGQYNGSSSLLQQALGFGAVPDIGVLQPPGTNLTNRVSTVSFSSVLYNQAGAPLVFTVSNTGTANLVLGGVSVVGNAAADYLLDTNGMATTVVPGGSTVLRVTFRPTAGGTRLACLQVTSNDGDESPFLVSLCGAGLSTDPLFNQGNLGIASSYWSVYASATQPDGKVLVGCDSGIVRLNTNGTRDSSVSGSTDGGVYCVVMQPDGKILVGGYFTTLAGQTRNRIARINSDGTLDSTFNPDVRYSVNWDGYVNGLAYQPDGKILLGGHFTSVGRQAQTNLARLNPDGTLDTAFNPIVNGTYINCLAVQADGKILLGGDFSLVGGQTRYYLARLNASGQLDTNFNSSAYYPYYVALQADGKILVGSDGGVVRLNANGTSDGAFSPYLDASVNTLALQANGKILIGGYFSSVNGQLRRRVARLNADGTLDGGFNAAFPSSGYIYGLAVQADGTVLAGGHFTSVGGQACTNLARLLNNETAVQILNAPDVTRAQWLRRGAAPEVEQVTFELSTDGGCNWVPLGFGQRTAGGWARVGLSLPTTGLLRARGRVAAGQYDGSSSLLEQVVSFHLPPTVTTTNDSGPGSLRQAIIDALPGDSISFTTVGTLVLTNGELQVCKDLTIVGPGATNLTLSGNYSNRVFSVCTNTTLNLSDLTVANGFSTNGGGIYNNGGTLNLTGCTLCSNRAAVVTTDMSQPVPFAPKGGAIYSLGSITAVNCLFCANSAQAEGPGHFAMGPGDTVSGGAVCNLGTLQSTGCLFQANQVVGVTAAWGPGGEADGGAVFNSSTAAYLAWNCTYTGNSAVGGVNMLTGPGGNGLGGAICGGGQLILGSVTFVANQASGGVYVDYPTGTGNAGGVGMGGAIYGAAQVCNGTFATNQAVGGQGGAGNLGGDGGNAYGGAVYAAAGLTNCSFAGNSAIGGQPGLGFTQNGQAGLGLGGGVYSGGVLKNTIVAYSLSGSNIWGTITDAGNNLSSDSTGSFTVGTSHTNTDPVLGPFGYYGGPTPTLPLLYGSPAINAGETTAAPGTDQRGFPRPFGSAADIGAYEWGAAPPTTPWFGIPSQQGTNGLNLLLSGEIGRRFEIHASSNLTQWSWLVTLANTTGQVTYTDSGATNQPKRFYKAIQLP